jgi:hypothetical protein
MPDDGALDDATDNSVKAGAVAAAGKDTDLLAHENLPY